MTIKLILWHLAWFAAGAGVFRLMTRVIFKAGHVRLNFMARSIPTSVGVGYALLTMLMVAAASLVLGDISNYAGPLALIVIGFSLLGLVDDLLEGRERGGFRGHLARGERPERYRRRSSKRSSDWYSRLELTLFSGARQARP